MKARSHELIVLKEKHKFERLAVQFPSYVFIVIPTVKQENDIFGLVCHRVGMHAERMNCLLLVM